MRLQKVLPSLLLLALAGCGGASNSSTGATPSYPNVAGNWSFRTADTDAGVVLTQSGGTLTGTAHAASFCFQIANDLPITGSVDTAGTLILNSSPNSSNIPADAQLQVRGSVSNGVLNNAVVGASCAGSGTGVSAGNLMPSLNGTYAGDLLSNTPGNPSVHVVVNVTQGTTVDQHGFLAVTGTAVATQSTCLNTQTMTSYVPSLYSIPQAANTVLGPFLYLGFGTATQSVQMQGMLSSDGTQFTVGDWILTGPNFCKDAGTGLLAKQS